MRSSASLQPVSKTLSRSLARATTPSHTSYEYTQDTEPVTAHRLSPQTRAIPGSPAKIPQGTWAPAAAQPGVVHSGSAAPAEPCRLFQNSVLPGQAVPGVSTWGSDGGAISVVLPALEPLEPPPAASPGFCLLYQAVPLCAQLCWTPSLLQSWLHVRCTLPQQAQEQLPDVRLEGLCRVLGSLPIRPPLPPFFIKGDHQPWEH